jgi:hypothetical protein
VFAGPVYMPDDTPWWVALLVLVFLLFGVGGVWRLVKRIVRM